MPYTNIMKPPGTYDGGFYPEPSSVESPAENLEEIAEKLSGIISVLPLIKPWAAWSKDTVIDMRQYAGVEIQVTGVGTPVFIRSANNQTYVGISATASGVAATGALALGFYNLKGGAYLKWTGTGTILIRGYN
jgi:hypothetical protein